MEYSGNHAHPTEKAVSVLKPLIQAFSRPGDIVLDAFAGSGSTLVAATLTGRRYLGIELEAKYCELARARLARVEERLVRPAEIDARPGQASDATSALRGLFQWLQERDYAHLARTVWDAMERDRS